MNVAFIGVGSISGIYLENLKKRFRELHVIGLCDLIPERAQFAAEKYGIDRVYQDMYEAFEDPEVDIVLNITRPYQHYEVTKQALMHGKHVYSEKPLGASIEEGRALVALAKEKGLLIGGAPDTFLGAGIQTCKKLIDDGFIGRPLAASAFMMGSGPDTWHPDPEFFYKYGGGPMMDMGPYYVTALINLMGRVDSVVGMTGKGFEERLFTCKEHYGETTKVEVPTHVAGLMRFTSGAIGNLITSFDVHRSELPWIEIYGERGTLWVPDPNTFGGPVRLFRPEDGQIREMPLLFEHATNSRGLGLLEMARALEKGSGEFCTSFRQTFHVLDIMTGFDRSQRAGAPIQMELI